MKNYIYDLYDRLRSSLSPSYLRSKSDHSKAIIALCIICFFWGTTWLGAKIGVRYMPALQLAGTRQLVAGSIFLIYFFSKGYKLPTRSQFFQFFWMSFLMFGISNGFNTWSVKFIPSGLGAVLGALSPIWIAIFSTFFFKDTRLNVMTVTGLILGLGGVCLIFYDYLGEILRPSFYPGIILAGAASMTWAMGTIYTVRHSRNVDPYYSMGWQMFISGIVLLIVSYFVGQFKPFTQVDIRAWYSLAYLVLIGSVFTNASFIYALKRLPATQVSIYAYVNPIVAVAIGALLNHEKITTLICLGTIVAIGGIYLVNTGFKKVETTDEKNQIEKMNAEKN
ncbi:MAG: drug/metabolite-transporting permease [Bacteroidetes bacterium]|nr:MAG: drug/metabolite-transporting permease [Bacteroidota bacterium]